MRPTEKLKHTKNPLYFGNRKTEALGDAYMWLLDTINDYASQNNWTEEQLASFKQLVLDSYMEKLAVYFIEHKLHDINNYITTAFDIALKKPSKSEDKEDFTRLLYYKNNLISNEQY